MARTKRKELEKEAKRKGELSQKTLNVEKSVSAVALLPVQPSAKCENSTANSDGSLQQILSLPKQNEAVKHNAVQVESHCREHQQSPKEATMCNRSKEMKVKEVSSASLLQSSLPHAPLSTLHKLNTSVETFMSERVDDSKPSTYFPGKVGSTRKSQSMTVISSKRVLLSASVSSPSQLPQAVVCVEDICKSPDGNILKIMKKQSSKEPAETEGISCGSEQNSLDLNDSIIKNPVSGDRTVSISITKNIFEQFDTEIIGRRSPRLRSNSPRGSCSQGSPVFQDASSRSSSEERHHSSIASAVRALRGISERVSEVRTQKRARSQEAKPVAVVMSDSKEDHPETLSPHRHLPQASANINLPDKGIQAPKINKTSASPAHSDLCNTLALGVKRARSPGRLGDDVAHVSSGRCPSDEEFQSIHSKKAKVDSIVSEGDTCLFHIMSSTSPQGRLPSKGMQISAEASSFLKDSDPGCLSADVQSSGLDAKTVSPVKSSEQGNERCNLSSPSHSQPQNAGAAESTDGVEPSLLCAMLLGGSEVAKTYEESRDHVHTHVPTTSRQQKSVVSSSSPRSTGEVLPSDELMADPPDPPTSYELPVLSRLPPLVKPDCAVLDLMLNEPVPCEEGNGFGYAFTKKNVVLLGLISKVTDYLKQFGSAVDSSVIEDAEKILCEDCSELGKEHLKAENHEAASKQTQGAKTTINCDADNENLLQEVQCKKDALNTCTSIVENLKTNDVVENMGTELDKKNLVVEHQPSNKQLQQAVQDKPLAEVTHADWRIGESSSAGGKQESPVNSGDLVTTLGVGTNLTVENNDKQMTEALQKNRSISGLTSLVNQSSVDRMSDHMNESSHSFPEDTTASTSVKIAKSDPSSVRPGSSRQQWQPKEQMAVNRGRPLWSRWYKIRLPSPLGILSKPEQASVNKKLSPFISKELDTYLRKCSNRLIVPAGPKSKLAKVLVLLGRFRDHSQLEAELNKCAACGHCSGDDCPGKTDEEDDEEEKDDFPKKFEPDFDEVDGLVFMSFANEIGMQAHIQVEKDLKWDKEPNAFLNIARFRAFEESRKEDSTSRRESQGLRGQHMRWRKYQRMYRKEFRGRQEAKERGLPWPLPKMPSKTSDVSKIKNWKQKLERDGIKTEETSTSQNAGCGGSESGSHKKKKRKTYVFSVKKKSKKSVPPPEKVCLMPAVSNHGREERIVESSGPRPAFDMQEEEDDYGKPIPIDQDGYMEDVQNSLKEMEEKQKGVMMNKILFSHLKMGPEDVDIFKRLGGWVTCQKAGKKSCGDKKSKNQTISSSSAWDSGDEIKTKRKVIFRLDIVAEEKAREAVLAVQNYEDVRDAHGSLQFSSDSNDMSILSEGGDFMDLTGDSPSPASSHKAKDSCDKPGCRYGCICHLCQSIGESDDLDQGFSATPQGRTCDKEYCRLGCICDSLEKSSKRPSPPHCRKPECVLECQCLKEVLDIPGSPHPLVKAESEADEKNLHDELKSEKVDSVDLAESSGDELPTLEKTNSRRQRSLDRYSNLPRRQTSYRIAKNLDAVSRKAMMLYETSEIYWEQSCNRRKKSSDSPGGPSAAPCTVTATVSTHLESMASPSDPCVFPASTSFTSVPQLPQPGLAQTAADHSSASLPVSTASVTSFSGQAGHASASPSSPVRNMRGSDMSCQNNQKTSQEVSPVIISDDEGLANKVSGIQHLRESPKSGKMKMMLSSEPYATPAVKQPASQLTATACHPAVTSAPLSASAASGTSSVGLTNPSYSQTRWHTSMVCLRANPSSKERRNMSDDVQEEDEIKLLEFIANCNWDGAKKDILLQVAQCLSRAQYPNPRTMLVGDFRVEILPKASKPSLIPPELRNKLPEMMYSIRVRVTQFRNSATNLHPVGLYRNSAAAPTGISARLGPSSIIPAAVPVRRPPGTSSSNKSDLHENMSDGSLGISGLGQLQISHSKSAAPFSLPGEAFLMQGRKIKNKRGLDSAGNQDGVKKKKKKDKKKNGMEASRKPPADGKNKKDLSALSTPVPIKVPIISIPNSMGTTQAFPISKLTPLIPGVSSQQVIGPVANLKDLKFIQLPGQKSLLQLLPASALGIKPADGKGSPQFLAVPVPIAPVPVKGDGKRMGTKAQIDVPLGAQAFSGVGRKSAQNVGGPLQPAPAVPVNSALDSNALSKKKKKKRKKKESAESAETSRSTDGVDGSASAAPKAASASVPAGLQGQLAPYPLHVVPNVAARGSKTEGAPAGQRTPAPISSVLFGNQIISISSPGRQSVTAGGEPVAAVMKAKPDSAASSGCRELSGLGAKQSPGKAGCSLLGSPRSLLSTTAKILSSTSPGGLESNTGEKVSPVLQPSQNASSAGDYLMHLKGKASKANGKSPQSSSSKQSKLPEKGKFVDEDSLASVGSQGSLSSNSILLSEDDGGDLEQENHMSGESSLVSSAAEDLDKTRTSQSMNKSRVHLVHKQREKNRRAEHYRMFQHLRDILFSIDLDRKLLPSLPKTKLLSKAELVVKYHQKRSQSLEKTFTIEQKRHSLLKQQLETKIDDLKKEGVREETIGSILKSLNTSCPPRVPVENQLSVEEQRLLSADYSPSSTSSNKLTVEPDSYSNGSSRLRSGAGAPRILYPWRVDGFAGSTGSSEESNSSPAASRTSSTSRGAFPGGSRPREKRRKSTRPVKLKSKPSSQFVIEIERADEDVGFVDAENSNCCRTRRKKAVGDNVDDLTMSSCGENTDVLKQTLSQSASGSQSADINAGKDCEDGGDCGGKVTPSGRQSVQSSSVSGENRIAGLAVTQKHLGEERANRDKVGSNQCSSSVHDSCAVASATNRGNLEDFTVTTDDESDMQ